MYILTSNKDTTKQNHNELADFKAFHNNYLQNSQTKYAGY